MLGNPGHEELVRFLRAISSELPKPDAILIISAHWEASQFTVQHNAQPELYYDYYGFPPESYELKYPAPGAPAVALRLAELLSRSNIGLAVDHERGFDHGVFIPLLLMYPAANIPCLQLSLREDLDVAAHIALGQALAPLRHENVLIFGSGSSFHNMQAFKDGSRGRDAAVAFDDWLGQVCCDLAPRDAANSLVAWQTAPEADYAHPREEHLLPLHVCMGAAMAENESARRVFNGDLMGYRMSGFLW